MTWPKKSFRIRESYFLEEPNQTNFSGHWTLASVLISLCAVPGILYSYRHAWFALVCDCPLPIILLGIATVWFFSLPVSIRRARKHNNVRKASRLMWMQLFCSTTSLIYVLYVSNQVEL